MKITFDYGKERRYIIVSLKEVKLLEILTCIEEQVYSEEKK